MPRPFRPGHPALFQRPCTADAAEAQATLGSVYHFFPDGKEAVAVAAIKHGDQEFAAVLREALDSEEDPSAAVEACARRLADSLRESGWIDGCPVTTAALETLGTDSEIQQACAAALRSWERLVHDKLLHSGLRAEDARDVATTIISTLEGAEVTAQVNRSEEPYGRRVGSWPAWSAQTKLPRPWPTRGNGRLARTNSLPERHERLTRLRCAAGTAPEPQAALARGRDWQAITIPGRASPSRLYANPDATHKNGRWLHVVAPLKRSREAERVRTSRLPRVLRPVPRTPRRIPSGRWRIAGVGLMSRRPLVLLGSRDQSLLLPTGDGDGKGNSSGPRRRHPVQDCETRV
ncbi:TetR/AcrR family transcriptional regulator [Nonomuraea mesophila]|uniref:TetR/AcrR family transcriptional regulator n=1 Tax=Nonomuraea mesophila TaxID=2530382 RepID=UPI001C6FE8A0|nr:TetR/AcrR family transcriptional regulator [Nonomuraea mesophila]